MELDEYLDQKNLHHAYLIEGAREEIVPEILNFINKLGIKTSGNPDFCQMTVDSFKIDEALSLRSMGTEKGFTSQKKFFVVCANNFSLDAQGVLLKIFEEPIENTHFFIIVPDKDALLKTLISRFFLIKSKVKNDFTSQEAEKFITMSLPNRILFIKDLLADSDEEDEIIIKDGARSKALKFLNALEVVLYHKLNNKIDFKINFFQQIFKAREYIRQPGSSIKSLLESLALVIPIF